MPSAAQRLEWFVLSDESNGIRESRGGDARNRTNSRPAHGQRGGRRVHRRKRAAAHAEVCTNGFWTATPPFAHADRHFHEAEWEVGRVTPEAKSCENNRAWERSSKVYNSASVEGVEIVGALVAYSKDSLTLPWVAASCCRDGSLAVVEPLWVLETSTLAPMSEWVATTYTCSHPTSNADTSLGRH